jgi:hypothetical protein
LFSFLFPDTSGEEQQYHNCLADHTARITSNPGGMEEEEPTEVSATKEELGGGGKRRRKDGPVGEGIRGRNRQREGIRELQTGNASWSESSGEDTEESEGETGQVRVPNLLQCECVMCMRFMRRHNCGSG